jgi:hypothetical protein
MMKEPSTCFSDSSHEYSFGLGEQWAEEVSVSE